MISSRFLARPDDRLLGSWRRRYRSLHAPAQILDRFAIAKRPLRGRSKKDPLWQSGCSSGRHQSIGSRHRECGPKSQGRAQIGADQLRTQCRRHRQIFRDETTGAGVGQFQSTVPERKGGPAECSGCGEAKYHQFAANRIESSGSGDDTGSCHDDSCLSR